MKKKLLILTAALLLVCALPVACAKKKAFTVTFDVFGGAPIAPVSGKVETEPTPELAGYTFEGWYTDAACAAERVTFPFVPKADTTLYAKWGEGKFTVTFDTDGGTEIAPVSDWRNAYLAQPEQPQKTGYRFDGWYTDEARTKEFSFLAARLDKDLTLYAGWVKLIAVTVIDGDNQTVLYGEDGETFAYDAGAGRVLEGLYRDADHLRPYTLSTYNADVTLYAQTRPLATDVTVTLDGLSVTRIGNEGETIDLPAAPDRQYYLFYRWEDEEGNAVTVYPASDITLYPAYKRDPKYARVSFTTTEFSEAAQPVFVEKGLPLSSVPAVDTAALTAKGLKAAGYLTDKNAQYDPATPVTGDMTLTLLLESEGIGYTGVYADAADPTRDNVYAAMGTPEYDAAEQNVGLVKLGYVVNGYTGTGTELYIPAFKQGYAVARIEEAAFRGNTTIIKAVLPDSIVFIGKSAFEGCTALNSVNIPAAVSQIEDSAFKGCTSLADVTFAPGSTLYYAGYKIFENCPYVDQKIQAVEASGKPAGVYIADNRVLYAFAGPMGDKQLFGSAKATLTTVAGGAFEGNAQLYRVSLPVGVTMISAAAFRNCTALQSVTVSQNLRYILENAFENCVSLTAFDFPPQLLQIGYEAFKGCVSLETANVPASVRYLRDYAFAGCTGLTTASIPAKAAVSVIPEGCFSGCTSLTQFIINDSIVTVESNAFAGCTSLEYAALGYTSACQIELIKADAFAGCTGLRVAFISRFPTDEGNGVFSGGLNLEQGAFPTGPEYRYHIYAGAKYAPYYKEKFAKIGLTGDIVRSPDTLAPTFNLKRGEYVIPASASVDLIQLIKDEIIENVSDNVTAPENILYRISKVTGAAEPKALPDGTYYMSVAGTYTVTFLLSDEYGSTKSASFTLIVESADY